MNKQWDFSRSQFDRFLNWLGSEPEQAGQKYESIRRSLIVFFYACCEPEQLADETINRVIDKVDSIVPGYSGDPALYFYGVAKNVRRESQRTKPPVTLPVHAASPADESDEKERLSACLDQCLNALPEADRDLILKYYQYDKGAKAEMRRSLGEQINLKGNAIRVRMYRIRSILERCIERCLEANEPGNKSS